MDGVLVVDKPQGVTSHDVVAAARRALGEKRVGHTGTLDPLATGVLPLACGRATRLVRFLTASDKDYEATIRFGLTTDTLDISGNTLTSSGRVPARPAIEAAVESLRGEYDQVPPAYSAKRVGRQRAYDLARRNERVALAPVRVRVSRADVVAVEGAAAVVAITCSAGFYVRAFAQALGEFTETGACLEALRRTRSGDFGLAEAVRLERVVMDPAAAAGRLVGMDRLLPGVPAARLTEEGRRRVVHGREVEPGHCVAGGVASTILDPTGATEWVRLLDVDGMLLAMATRGPGGALHPAVVLI